MCRPCIAEMTCFVSSLVLLHILRQLCLRMVTKLLPKEKNQTVPLPIFYLSGIKLQLNSALTFVHLSFSIRSRLPSDVLLFFYTGNCVIK